MNREIKFRCWFTDFKEMCFSDNPASRDDVEVWNIDADGVYVEVQTLNWNEGGGEIHETVKYIRPWQKVMQFTGVKDCEGVDVFEGDIVVVKGRKRIGKYVTEIILEGVSFRLKKNDTYINDNYILPSMITVVGNIYQTPELLKS